jgi:hypothetical protein
VGKIKRASGALPLRCAATDLLFGSASDPVWHFILFEGRETRPGERGGRLVGACSRDERRISNCSFQSGMEETNVMNGDEISTSMPSFYGVATWMSSVCLERPSVCMHTERARCCQGSPSPFTDLGCPYLMLVHRWRRHDNY